MAILYTHQVNHIPTTRSRVEIIIPFNKSYTNEYGYLIPRAAFFDNRTRGEYKNATVILTHMIKSKVNLVGCVVDGHRTDKIKLEAVFITDWTHKMQPKCTHDNFLIFCFDTPGHNNSEVTIIYENPKNKSETFRTDSEHPLFIPKSRENFTSSVMACTTVFGSPSHLGAWLRYQKTIGVDFVYINAVENFLSGYAYNDSFLQESIRNGFIQLKVWKEYLKSGALFYHSQALFYQSCIYRFQGIYDYAIMSDVDDFAIPALHRDIGQILKSLVLLYTDPKLSGVHNAGQFLQYLFGHKLKLGGIKLYWLRYSKPDIGFDYDAIVAGNFFQYIGDKPGENERNYKSIHKLSATSDVGIHNVAHQMKGYTWIYAPRDMVYMAHLSEHQRQNYNSKICL